MTLEELITSYGRNNADMLYLKKECDAQNKEIKSRFLEKNLTELSAGGYVAKVQAIDKSDFDQEVLLDLLKSMGATEAIKTKEYVDMDVLEDLIYNNKIDAKELSFAKVTKTQYRLTIAKEKKKKDED